MSTITVRFTGICTHVRFLGEGQNALHRVVLTRADHGAFLNGARIPPHIATLRIDPADIAGIDGYPYGLETLGPVGAWRLCGVTLSLEGGTGTFTRDPNFDLVPRLETESKVKPELSSEVTEHGQAACYFDLSSGHLSAVEPAQKGDAINAVLQVETTETPGLRVTCFWNGESSLIRLRPDALIDVEHTGYPHSESDQDFLLHYRVLVSVPEDAKVPPESKSTANPHGDIRVGCSNSQYP
jgi:hypothetical protein